MARRLTYRELSNEDKDYLDKLLGGGDNSTQNKNDNSKQETTTTRTRGKGSGDITPSSYNDDNYFNSHRATYNLQSKEDMDAIDRALGLAMEKAQSDHKSEIDKLMKRSDTLANNLVNGTNDLLKGGKFLSKDEWKRRSGQFDAYKDTLDQLSMYGYDTKKQNAKMNEVRSAMNKYYRQFEGYESEADYTYGKEQEAMNRLSTEERAEKMRAYIDVIREMKKNGYLDDMDENYVDTENGSYFSTPESRAYLNGKISEYYADLEAAQKERDEYDLDKGEKELNSMRETLDMASYTNPQETYAKNLYERTVTDYLDAGYSEADAQKEAQKVLDQEGLTLNSTLDGTGYDNSADMEKEYNKKLLYHNSVKAERRADEMLNNAMSASDFEEYAEKGDQMTAGVGAKNKIGMYRKTGAVTEDIANAKGKTANDYENAWSLTAKSDEQNLGHYMTDDEYKAYSYYLAKEADGSLPEGTAKEYVSNLLETVNARAAREAYQKIDGNTAAEIMYGFVAGTDQFVQGMKNVPQMMDYGDLIKNKNSYIAPSVGQRTGGAANEDLADVGWQNFLGTGMSPGQMAYNTASTVANMAPTIIASAAANYIIPGSGEVVGNGLMGLSVGGNEYANLLNNGELTMEQARLVASVKGAWEGISEYYLGSIEGLGRAKFGAKFTKTAAGTAMRRVFNGFISKALERVIDAGQEGIEEIIQDLGETVIDGLSTGEWKWSTLEEQAANFWGGVAAALVMGAPSNIASDYTDIRNARTVRKAEGGIDALKTAGSKFSADSLAYKLAGNLNKNSSVLQISNAIREMNGYLSQQNQTDIKNALVERGVGKKDATAISKWLAEYVEGGKITSAQRTALANSQMIADVMTEVIIDQNSTVNQRMRTMGEANNTFKADPYVDEYGETHYRPILTGNENAGVEVADKEKVAKLVSEGAKNNIDIAHAAESMNVAKKRTEKTNTIEKAKEKTSDTNSAVNTETGSDIDIEQVESIAKDGSLNFKLKDGSTVNSKDVAYRNEAEAIIYETSAAYGYDAETTNAVVRGFNAVSNLSASDYVIAMNDAYRYGYIGQVIPASVASTLTQTQKDYAYKLGREASQRESDTKTNSIKNSSTGMVQRKGKVVVEKSLRNGMNSKQKSAMQAAKIVAGVTGAKIFLYESVVDKDGGRVFARDIAGHHAGDIAPNGFYLQNGTIYLDINSGNGGQGYMAFTLSHELTHFIREWSPAKFKVLADFLVEQYGSVGKDVDTLVKEYQATHHVSFDVAFEEVVAQSMESMLTDTNALEKMQMLYNKDASLVEKIKQYVDNVLARIKKAYSGIKVETENGRTIQQMTDQLDKLSTLFAEAAVDAGENYKQIGLNFDENTESVNPELASERTWNESDYVQNVEQASEEMAKALGISISKAKAYIDSVNSIAKIIANDRTRLDYEASEGVSSFVGNTEYGGSIDFSTICKKRRLLTGTFTAIQQALKDTALTAEEVLTIRKMMDERGYEVSCGLCYVEGSRAKMGEYAKDFLNEYAKTNPEYMPNMAEINTPDGIEKIRMEHPEVYQEYQKYMNGLAQRKPKLYQMATEYKGEILNKFRKTSNVEEKNYNGGLRLQSFSDFEIIHLIDCMQVIMDMSRVGLAGQAYTKVPDFALALGGTGLKINLSLIAKGVDANGKLVLDEKEGMKRADAEKIRGMYSDNVGTIVVVFNDEQLTAAMSDNFIDFIIPFHRSQWNSKMYELMGLPANAKDYTKWQNESYIEPVYNSNGKKQRPSNYMPNTYWDFTKTGKENAEAYLKMCAANNRLPKFSNLLDKNSDGSYSLKADGSTDGYWKLLIDFKMYNNDGVGVPQKPVKPNFNMAEAERMLDEYEGGHRQFPVAQDVVDDFLKQYGNEHSNELYSFRGYNKDGIEVYETSEETKKLTWDERLALFKSILKNEYSGRTAKFIRNGHTYYARLDPAFAGKTLFGEKHFSEGGRKAYIKMGADGDVFNLVENSTYSHSGTDTKNHKRKDGFTDYFDYFVKNVQIDGTVYALTATVKRQMGTTDGYTYTLFLRKDKNKVASPTISSTTNANFQVAGDATNNKIAQSANSVNTTVERNSDRNDITETDNFKKWFSNSKVVDEDGKPLVVYHGTDAKFDAFDVTKTRSSMDIQGTFFSPYEEDAGGYGGNVGSYYLSIKNPADEGTAYKALNLYKGRKDAGAKARDYLIRKGYDGVYNGYDEYIAFYPNQIKSTNNYGTFDANTDKYMYSNREFVEAIDSWNRDGRPSDEQFILGSTGDVLQGLGAIESDIYMLSDKVNTILRNHPEMTIDEVKRIPEILENPVMILESQNKWRSRTNTRLVLFGTVKAKDGRPILAALDMRPMERNLVIDDMQKVVSAYTKDNNPVDFLKSSNVLYVDNKKATSFLRSIGFQLPTNLNYSGFIGNITYDTNSVKFEGKNFNDVVDYGQNTGQLHSDRNVDSLKEKQLEIVLATNPMMDDYHVGIRTIDDIMTFEETVRDEVENDAGESFYWGDFDLEDAKKALKAGKVKVYSSNMIKNGNFVSTSYTQALEYAGMDRRKVHSKTVNLNEVAWINGDEGVYANPNSYLNSDRDPNAVDSRTLLANALATTTQNEYEAKKIADYQAKIESMAQEQNKLSDLRAEIKEISFSKGKRDTARLKALREEATKTANRINIYDKQLLRLESTQVLQNVLQREKLNATKKAEAEGKERLKQYKEKALSEQKALMQKYRERTEARKTTQVRNEVKKYVENFRKMLMNPTERKYIPSRLVNGIIDVYSAIDPTGVDQNTKAAEKYRSTKEALADLKLQYDSLQSNPDYDFNSEFDADFSKEIAELAESIGDTPLRDMNRAQLEDVYNVLHDISAMVKDATKQIGTSESVSNYEAGQQLISEMEYIKKTGLTTNKISDLFREWTLNPMRAVREMSAFNENGRLVKLFNDLNEGRRKADTFKMNETKKFDALRESKEGKKAFNDAVEKASIKAFDVDGNEVAISKMQAMQAILTYEREAGNENRNHLGSPVHFTDVKLDVKGKYSEAFDKGHDIMVDEAFVKRVTGELSAWDKAYLDVARTFFREDSANAINEISLITKHRLTATEKNHIPYKVNQDYISKESDNLKYDATIGGAGILKSVKNNAPQQLVMRGLNTVIDEHIDDVAKIYGLTVPVRNFNKVFNMKQTQDDGGGAVKVAIRNAWGENGLNLVDQAVADLQSPRRTETFKPLSFTKQGFVSATLASNISVWMKQAASYPTAGAVLSNKSLMKALPNFGKNLNSTWAEIDAHTSQHWIRRQGLSTQELGEMNQSHGWQNRLNDKLGVFSPMNWIQAMDVKTTAVLWEACKYEAESNGISRNNNNYWDAVTKLYDKTIEDTQPMYDSLHRAEITKNGQLKNIIMFQTQPIQNSGILREGAMQYSMAKKKYGKNSAQAKRAGVQYRMAVTSQVASHLTFTAMTLVAAAFLHKMNPYRDDDDKEVTFESIAKEFGTQFAKNFFGAVFPVVGSYAFSIAEKVAGSNRYDVLSDPTVDKINTTIDNFAKLKEPSWDNFRTMAFDVASYFGIPASNAYNIVNGARLHIEDIANDEFLSFEAGFDRTVKQNVSRMYSAYTKGDTKKLEEIASEMVNDKVSSGKTEKEAKTAIRSSITSQFKDLFLGAYRNKDNERMAEIRKFLNATGMYDDVVKTTQDWIKKSAE